MPEESNSPSSYSVGKIVMHPKRLEWGPGRVLEISGSKLTVYFRDLPGGKPGEAVKIIDTSHVPLVAASFQSDPQLNNLPPYKDGRFASKTRRLTFEEYLDFFRRRFPLYFQDREYIGNRNVGERAHKLEARQLFSATLACEEAELLLETENVVELRHRALAVEEKLNLLSVYEKAALRDGLESDAEALAYFRSLINVLRAERVSEDTFGELIEAVERLPAEKSRVATWPVLTLFPFVAQPDRHMFLKPEVTNSSLIRLPSIFGTTRF